MTKPAPDAPIDLDPVSVEASGPTAAYEATRADGRRRRVDRRPVGRPPRGAGTSAGEVASNDASKIVLKANWAGGRPAPGTPYVIAGRNRTWVR
jgi:hypothetical protein